jgi:predicted ABC-type sugar transport system permease subunit
MRSSALNRPAEAIRRLSVLGILLLICVVFALGSSEFLTASNLLNVALQTSIIAIVAIGMTFVIFTAGIDLSVGSMMALCGAIAAGLAVRQGMDTYLSISIGLGIGLFLGAVNGLMIVKGGIPPFVATLSMLAIARGLTLVYTEGRPIAGLDERFIYWGTGQVLGIPLPVIIMVVIAVVAHIVTRYTPFGLHVYSTGGNEETTRLASISPDRIKLAVYMISGFSLGRHIAHRSSLVCPTQRSSRMGTGCHCRAGPRWHQPIWWGGEHRGNCNRRIHHRCIVQWSQLDGRAFVLPAGDKRPGIHFGCYRGSDQQASALKIFAKAYTVCNY